MIELLHRLRHVGGVIGSFTCTLGGQLIEADLPERFPRADLEATAARLSNLLQALGDSLPDPAALKLSFPEHHLHVRRHPSALLCVLATHEVDRQMLQLTTRLVLRQLAPAP